MFATTPTLTLNIPFLPLVVTLMHDPDLLLFCHVSTAPQILFKANPVMVP